MVLVTVIFSSGIVLGSCRNHEVLQHAARFLSILGKLVHVFYAFESTRLSNFKDRLQHRYSSFWLKTSVSNPDLLNPDRNPGFF